MKKNRQTYSVGIDGEQQFILCKRCMMASYNMDDIKNLYCGNCDLYHFTFPLLMGAMCLLNAPVEELGNDNWIHLRDDLNKRYEKVTE